MLKDLGTHYTGHQTLTHIGIKKLLSTTESYIEPKGSGTVIASYRSQFNISVEKSHDIPTKNHEKMNSCWSPITFNHNVKESAGQQNRCGYLSGSKVPN